MSLLSRGFNAVAGVLSSKSKVAGLLMAGVMAFGGSAGVAMAKPTPQAKPAQAQAADEEAQMIQIPDNPFAYEYQLKRTVRLVGEINEDSATRVIAQLKMLDDLSPKGGRDITLIIQSPGGEVDAGFAIYDAIQSLKSDVRTVCEGSCSSMGAFILAAGAPGKRSATPNALIMIHQPSAGASGKVSDIQIAAKMLQATKDRMRDTMSRHSGLDPKDLEKLLDRDTFISAQEARDLGLIDSVEPARKPLPAIGNRPVSIPAPHIIKQAALPLSHPGQPKQP